LDQSRLLSGEKLDLVMAAFALLISIHRHKLQTEEAIRC